MIFFHGLRLYRLAAAEADMSYTPPFGGAIFFSMVRMIELLHFCNDWRRSAGDIFKSHGMCVSYQAAGTRAKK